MLNTSNRFSLDSYFTDIDREVKDVGIVKPDVRYNPKYHYCHKKTYYHGN